MSNKKTEPSEEELIEKSEKLCDSLKYAILKFYSHSNYLWIEDWKVRVETSSKRRPKYYTKDKKLPKRFIDKETGKLKDGYIFKGKYLCEGNSGERVVRNSRSVNTPKTFKINGQSLWNKGMHWAVRNKIKETLGKMFSKYFPKKFKKIKKIIVDVHLMSEEKNFDLDNKSIFYQKALQDAMVDEGLIEDDSVEVIPSFSWTYYPIDRGNKALVLIRDWEEHYENLLS